MPNRIAFSIWFTLVVYGLYRMVSIVYCRPITTTSCWSTATGDAGDDGGHPVDRPGAVGADVRGIVPPACWRGRPLPPRQCGDVSGGLAGLFGWLLWVGDAGVGGDAGRVRVHVSLLIARVVAETGMPFLRIETTATALMKLGRRPGWRRCRSTSRRCCRCCFDGLAGQPAPMAVQGWRWRSPTAAIAVHMAWLFLRCWWPAAGVRGDAPAHELPQQRHAGRARPAVGSFARGARAGQHRDHRAGGGIEPARRSTTRRSCCSGSAWPACSIG